MAEPGDAATSSVEWSVKQILDWTTSHFRDSGSPTPRLDAEILLAHVRRCPRIELYTRYDEIVVPEQRAAMRELVKRRGTSEPIAYLVGHREFFGLDFAVDSRVLIPRPETETLVVELLSCLQSAGDNPQMLEIGTGSGCIAVAAAVQAGNLNVVAVDLSPAALEVATANATRHGVTDRIRFVLGDGLQAVEHEPDLAQQRFDLIVSNPPYVTEAELDQLPPDVREFEPLQALVSGPDGLDLIRRLIADAPGWLVPGGRLLIELDPDQVPAVQKLFAGSGEWQPMQRWNDLAGQVRVVGGQLKSAAD